MDTNYPLHSLELWGGLECTINRVGDDFRDQLKDAGHYQRNDDIDQIATLGITSLRYPVLWEAHQQDSDTEAINWDRSTNQLEKIRSHGITPIVGLVHHGSGPRFTSLMSDDFPEKLASYAFKVATQFPWIEYYTPVNEPLTTARFSGLYGCWFPHHKNDISFAKMIFNQLKAVVLSMKEIRKVNPNAKLVQTEDLAKVHSTPLLKYQADFENARRWLTYDILCGRLNEQHNLWKYFIGIGIDRTVLEFFISNPCPPQIMGFNYYVTSERFLDEHLNLYHRTTHGGNGRHRYADIAAVRVKEADGLKALLREAWERYRLPLALTEVHMNCTREEQLRWFKESWDASIELIKEGIAIKAITSWSLLGAFDWVSLLTRNDRDYEPGVFDVTKNFLRPTALAKMVKSLAATGAYHHPVVNERGWWNKNAAHHEKISANKSAPIMIIGCDGTLGNAFVRICERRSLSFRAFSHRDLDFTKDEQIIKAIDECKPWAVINAAGYVRVDDAETEWEQCFELNARAPAHLASICKKYGLQLMTFSSDLVFDGQKHLPYIEIDSVKPLNVYGHSKAKGEALILNNFSSSLIIRTSAFFGPWDKYNFGFHVLNSLKESQKCIAVKDVIVSPTYVPDLVDKSSGSFNRRRKRFLALNQRRNGELARIC